MNLKTDMPGFANILRDANLSFVVAAGNGTNARCNSYGRLGEPETLRLYSVSLFSLQVGSMGGLSGTFVS
eukprot:3629573-Pyramimonas_sp.AAC.1